MRELRGTLLRNMRSISRDLRAIRPRTRAVAYVAVVVAVPVLLFSTFLPSWVAPAAVALLILVFAATCIRTRRLLGHTPADWALALLVLTLPVGLWASADRGVTLARTYAFVANLALFWAMAAQSRSGMLRWSGWGMLVAGLLLTGVFLVGTSFSVAKLPFISQDIYSLLPGGFTPFWNKGGFNSNLAGGVLALFWPTAVMLAIAGESRRQRLLALLTVTALSTMLLLMQSRGALIAVLVILPIMTTLYDRRWLTPWLIVVVAGAAFLAARGGGISPEALLGSSEALGGSSLQGRTELWSRAIYLIQDFSFTGVGMGMFEPVVKLLYPPFLIAPDTIFSHAHNIYLQAAAEMGIPGLVGYVALYIVLGFLLLRKGMGRGRERYRIIALGLLGSLLVYLVHGITDAASYFLRTAAVVWSLFGLMVAVSTVNIGTDRMPTLAQTSFRSADMTQTSTDER